MNRPMHGIGQPRRESFARYYLRQVAMGEGCNCGEHVLGSRGPAAPMAPAGGGRGPVRRLLGHLRFWKKRTR